MLNSLFAIMGKELRQTLRDKRMVGLLVVAPLIQLIVLGYAVNMDIERVPTVIADEDLTPQSRKIADELTAGDSFLRVGRVASGKAAMELVKRGKATLAIVLPRGFSARRTQGKPAHLQVVVNGGDSYRAIVAQSAVSAFVLLKAMEQAQKQAETIAAMQNIAPRLPSISVEPRILYNPRLDSQIFFVPGVAATLLLIVTLIITSVGLAREKEMGTLEQVMVTPIPPTLLILGKTLPYAVIGLLDLGLVVAFGSWIFDVPLRGSLWLVLLGGTLYMVTTLGLGLFMGTLARTQQQALMGDLFIMMLAILLSGFLTPVENMPSWLQVVSGLTPVRHFVEIMRAVLLKDASFTELAGQFAALAGMGVVVFFTSARLLRRSLA